METCQDENVSLDFSAGGGMDGGILSQLVSSEWFQRHFSVCGMSVLLSGPLELCEICQSLPLLHKLHLHGAVLTMKEDAARLTLL